MVFSQTDLQPRVIEAMSTCERAAASFDVFAYHTAADKNIIIISYLGKNDSRKNIAATRLLKSKIYLTDKKGPGYFRSQEKIITAIGIDKSENGKLDFYIDGKLEMTMFFRKNTDFRLLPCYEDPELKRTK